MGRGYKFREQPQVLSGAVKPARSVCFEVRKALSEDFPSLSDRASGSGLGTDSALRARAGEVRQVTGGWWERLTGWGESI